MVKLRPYQAEAIDLLLTGFSKGHKRQVLCLPTGSGKTVTFAEMITRAARKGTRTLILTDRIELFQQSFAAISKTGVKPEVLHAGTEDIPAWSLVTIAMVETLSRRLKRGLELDPQLIIIDEAHKGNFSKIIDLYPDSRVIGATATPVGKHFYKYYTNIVNNISIAELVDQGYLAPCRAFEMQDDLSDLYVQGGEFTEKSLYKHYSSTQLFGGVIEKYIEKAYGTKALCFNVNIKHAQEMTAAFLSAGIVSDCITSKTPDHDRTRILDAFKHGHIQVLNNCGVLTTGYDEPSIETIIMNRATMSVPLFLQCLGRGSRPFSNKPFFTVLDFGLNHTRHGMWQEDRVWRLKEVKKSSREGVKPCKICPDCDALLSAAANVCSFCGHEFTKEVIEAGQLVELTKPIVVPSEIAGKKISECSVEELAHLLKIGRYRYPFIVRVVRTRGEAALKEFQRLQGYKKGWVYAQMLNKANIGYNDITIR